MDNPFHACASCIHFRTEKKADGMRYFCNRLQYETKPNFKFNCWTPKEHVKALMERRLGDKKDEYFY